MPTPTEVTTDVSPTDVSPTEETVDHCGDWNCLLCRSTLGAEAFWRHYRDYWKDELDRYDVEWDPTIRF